VTAFRLHKPETLVDVTVGGLVMRLPKGEPLATALACEGIRLLRCSPRAGTPRGAFCFMGACQECTILVNGRPEQSCMVPVREGLVVELRGAP
jgi:predicted molibdopterin-dependent oxidoreductase YjgC